MPHIASSWRSRLLEQPTPPFSLPAGSRKPPSSEQRGWGCPRAMNCPLRPSKEMPKVLLESLLWKNSHCDKNSPSMQVKGQSSLKEAKAAEDLKLLFSKESQKPTINNYLRQNENADLFHQHTEELEKLQSLRKDAVSTSRRSAPSRLEASIQRRAWSCLHPKSRCPILSFIMDSSIPYFLIGFNQSHPGFPPSCHRRRRNDNLQHKKKGETSAWSGRPRSCLRRVVC